MARPRTLGKILKILIRDEITRNTVCAKWLKDIIYLDFQKVFDIKLQSRLMHNGSKSNRGGVILERIMKGTDTLIQSAAALSDDVCYKAGFI